jgi:hypothetical protein
VVTEDEPRLACKLEAIATVSKQRFTAVADDQQRSVVVALTGIVALQMDGSIVLPGPLCWFSVLHNRDAWPSGADAHLLG